MAGNFYWRLKDKSKVDEIAKLEPAVAGADKERDWIKAFWENFRNDINIAQDFLAKVNNNDLNPTSFEMKQHPKSTVRLGAGLPSDMASETNIVLPILKAVGSPPISGNENTIISNCDVLIDPGHTLTNSRGDKNDNIKYNFYFTDPVIRTFLEKKLTAIYGNANMLTIDAFQIEYYLDVIIAKDLQAALTSKGFKVSYVDFPTMSNTDEIGKIQKISLEVNPKVFIAIHNNAGKRK